MPLATMDTMEFGHALDCILLEILLAGPSMGPVQLKKIHLSDGFYPIGLNVDDIPKLRVVVFPTKPGQELLITSLLGMKKNSQPFFCAATENIADLANQ